MSSIGPDLPPHLLAKRKRQQEESSQDVKATGSGAKLDSDLETPEKRRRVIGPARPSGVIPTETQDGCTIAAPPRKVAGPAMPPAPLDKRPIDDPESSDDELGPALPTGEHDGQEDDDDTTDTTAPAPAEPERLRRDDWMTMAPQQDDLAARMDPTKLRARGFNTGKAARERDSGSSAAWHETGEQKQKRLADEVLGIASTPAKAPSKSLRVDKEKAERDEKTARRVKEAAEKARGPSLLERHQHAAPDGVEDDPSKRAFNYEKDMGNASRITGSQKREMISKAGNYSSRFSGGSYL